MHIGATYAVRISVLHGTSHGLMALPVHGVVRVRLQGGWGNDAQEVDVSTLSEEIGKWDGFGIWDTSTHAQPLADRPAQQIKADLTFRLRMKVQHHDLMLVWPAQESDVQYAHENGRQACSFMEGIACQCEQFVQLHATMRLLYVLLPHVLAVAVQIPLLIMC